MKQIIRLAWSYLKYYRKQTMALFLGIVLSCALFTGIGSLQKSGNHAARENARTKSGDWHYTMRCDTDWFEEFEKTYQPGKRAGLLRGKNRCADDAQSDRGAL